MDFLVIGGDAAGMSAASRAKRNRPEMNVTVLEKTGDVSYSACGMPYNIADPHRDMDDLVVRQAEVFRKKQGINLLTHHTAQTIDAEKQCVRGVDGTGKPFEKPYDKLLIATGARPVMPAPVTENMPGIMGLKTLAQGRDIKAYLQEKAVRSVVIIGMGYIALEMSEALKRRGIDVTMVKPRPRLLPWMAQDLSEAVKAELAAKGVNLMMGCDIQSVNRQPDGTFVVRCGAETLTADMVLSATGVVPNSEIAKDAGIELGPEGAIAVDAGLRTSAENVYAAGDCADAFHQVTGQRAWIPLALRANRAGWAVADNVCGKEVALPGIVGTAVFRVFDMEVARTGLNVREAEKAGFTPAEMVIQSRSRAHAHPGARTIWVQMVGDRASGRLLGVQMVGKEGVAHRINAPAVALSTRMTVAAFAQCDLAYAPPFGPVWDPMLTTANQWLKSYG